MVMYIHIKLENEMSIKKRNDAYARAAATDIVNGLNMALRALGELQDPDAENMSSVYSDLDNLRVRARVFAKRRVTAAIWREATGKS